MTNHNEPTPDDAPRNERAESGLSSIRDARLTARAYEKGWIKKGRWRTQEPQNKLVEDIKEHGDITLAEEGTIAIRGLLRSPNDRVKVAALRALVSMERQNQVDQLHALKAGDDDQTLPGSTQRTPDQAAQEMDDSVPPWREEAG
jgi:hypothetical protein